ncbi:MAG: radical SAM protein [Candidatus Azambacteria bacterium]|nr:radical SAM protein [Candidatus Azambacteria bacterium]
MDPRVSLIADTLVVKDGKTYILYSPYKGKVTRVSVYPNTGSDVYNKLKELGFFKELPISTRRDDISNWKGFNSLTLLITRRCNMACSYCYASAKPDGQSMTLEIALNALRWFNNQLNGNTLRICFHGGGEPTLEENLIKATVAEAKNIRNKKTRFQIVTNGTADIKFTGWLMSENFGISISTDGPPTIQNRNRPLAVGGNSSEIVERTVRHLVESDYKFTVRLTFSPVDNVKEIVRYFGGLGVRSLHFEPLFPHGREYGIVAFGKNQNLYDIYSPNGNEMVAPFLKALTIAKEYKMKITNGHLSHFVKGNGYFCGAASGRSMIVTHDGFLSACLEVVDAEDKDFNLFRLGNYLPQEEKFVVDLSRLNELQNRHADTLPECKSCYARYTCAGGCAIKAVRASGNFFNPNKNFYHNQHNIS